MPRRAENRIEGAQILALFQSKWPEITFDVNPGGMVLATCPSFDTARRTKGGRRGRPSDRDDYFHNGDLRCLKAALEWEADELGYQIMGVEPQGSVRPSFTPQERNMMRKYQNSDDKGRDRN